VKNSNSTAATGWTQRLPGFTDQSLYRYSPLFKDFSARLRAVTRIQGSSHTRMSRKGLSYLDHRSLFLLAQRHSQVLFPAWFLNLLLTVEISLLSYPHPQMCHFLVACTIIYSKVVLPPNLHLFNPERLKITSQSILPSTLSFSSSRPFFFLKCDVSASFLHHPASTHLPW
jgi:hypothetical protein